MKQYDGYIFDLYGTLVDIHTDEGRPGFWRKVAAYYRDHGAAWDGPALRADYLRRVGEAEARMRAAAPAGAAVEIDLLPVFAALYAAKGVTADAALLDGTTRFFRAASTTHLRAYAGAKALLAALRKRGRVILLSNAQRCFTLPELDALGLRDCFDEIFISSDLGCKKPDPRFFRAMLERTGLRADRCLMTGNDPACDIAGALAVGMDAAYIRSGLSPAGSPASVPGAALSLPFMDLARLRRQLTVDG